MKIGYAIVLGAAIVALAAVGMRFYGQSQFRAGQEACEQAHRTAELEAFREEATRLNGLSQTLNRQLLTLSEAQPKVIERYTRVEVASPLPADCVLDAVRLQHGNDGISQANTTGQLEPALSGSAAAR